MLWQTGGDGSPETVLDVIASLPKRGNRRAVGFRGDFGIWWWSRRRLHAESRAYAAALAAAGVTTGDAVVLWAGNGPHWLAAAFGSLLVGAVVVPLDASAPPATLAAIAAEAAATLVVHDRTGDLPLDRPHATLRALRARSAEAPPVPDRTARPEDPAFVMFTSGTTGPTRGVALTHGNLAAQVQAFWRWRHLLRPRSRTLLCLSPLSHVQGLVVGAVVPLALGAAVLWTDRTDPSHVIRTIRDNKVAALLAVPRVHSLLAEELRRSPSGRPPRAVAGRISGMRFLRRRHHLFLATHRRLGYSFWVAMVGGATLPPPVERFWYEAGYVLVHGYGLTETSALAAVKVNSPFGARLGTVGKPVKGHRVDIGPDGEVVVEGPAVAGAVWSGGALVPLPGGALHTGDLGSRQADGAIVIRGRGDDVIVTAEGHNVEPAGVEEALRLQPGVLDAVVVASDRGSGVEVHAALRLDAGASAADAVAAANAILPAERRVTAWSIWEGADFPRSTLLKVRRGEVAAALDAPPASDHLPPLTTEGLRDSPDRRQRIAMLARFLSAAPGGDTGVDGAVRLGDLGLSSLDLVEVLSAVERARMVSTEGIALGADDSLADLRHRVIGSAPGAVAPPPPRMDRWWFRAGQDVIGPPVRALWAASLARRSVEGASSLAGVTGPFIVACGNHHHGADALVVARALPRRLRRGPLVVTTRWLFEGRFETGAVNGFDRLRTRWAYRWGMPLVFPYVLWPTDVVTSHGLLETGRLLDRGYHPIVFPERAVGDPGTPRLDLEPGVGVVAAASGATVVPALLEGNEGIDLTPRWRRPQVTVRFGQPLPVEPGADPAGVSAALLRRMETLRDGGPQPLLGRHGEE